jgi:hypothetical protein
MPLAQAFIWKNQAAPERWRWMMLFNNGGLLSSARYPSAEDAISFLDLWAKERGKQIIITQQAPPQSWLEQMRPSTPSPISIVEISDA